MKKVMLIALMGLFTMTLFAQNQEKTKPAVKKKETPKTEVTKPAQATQAAQPAKEAAKPAKHAKHGEKKSVTTPKK